MDLCEYNLESYISQLWQAISVKTNLEHNNEVAFNEETEKKDARMKLVWGIMTQIANAVAYIHGQAMIHRDLKPSNGLHHHRPKH
jgi:serine/threonine protein kinase